MLRGRGWFAVGLGLGLVLSAPGALGQTAKPRGHVVLPDNGPPPEQAQQLDPPAQYEHAADPEPPPEPELPPEPPQTPPPTKIEAQTAPDPPAAEQAAPAPQTEPALPAEPSPLAAAAVEPSLRPAAPAGSGVQNELQKDTAALLQLAQDLKTEIEKAGNNTLSLVAIRKAEEIQKLSRNLRERLRDQGQVPVSK